MSISTTDVKSNLHDALSYARLGWRVHPLSDLTPGDKDGGKRPRLKDWQKHATVFPSQISEYWMKWPHANIGLKSGASSGVIVLDCDTQEAVEWVESRLESLTPRANTPNGAHFYFEHPGFKVKNYVKIRPGLDIRGDGGNVVLPPSIHPSGERYEWIVDPRGLEELLPPIPCPPWLVEMLQNGRQVVEDLPPAPLFDYEAPTPDLSVATSSYELTNDKLTAPPQQLPEVSNFPELRAKAWAEKALQGILGELRTGTSGAENRRNQTLNDCSLRLGQMIGHGLLERWIVESLVRQAASHIFQVEPKKSEQTMQRALDDGIEKKHLLNMPNFRDRRDQSPKPVGHALVPPPPPQPVRPAAAPQPEPVIEQGGEVITTLKGMGYDFRLNECNDEIEVLYRGKFTRITDPLRAKILTQMLDAGFSNQSQIDLAYTAYALDNAYHPIKNFLASLRWDGQDHIDDLATYFVDAHTPIKGDDGITRTALHTWLRRWLIGAVSKVFEGKQNMMLVLDGAQGCGKSHFVEWLGSVMPKEYYMESPINPDDKDFQIRLASKFVWEVVELGATTRRADVEALKAFITTKTVTARKAYGRFDLIKPATASLIGTINNERGFLRDATGNRRFMIVTINVLDWAYTSEMDPRKVWAHAYHLYQQGEDGSLSKAEKEAQKIINSNFEVDDPMGDYLSKHFCFEPGYFMSSADIIDTLIKEGYKGNTTQLSMQLSSTATRWGLSKGRGKGAKNKPRARGYYGLRLRTEAEKQLLNVPDLKEVDDLDF